MKRSRYFSTFKQFVSLSQWRFAAVSLWALLTLLVLTTRNAKETFSSALSACKGFTTPLDLGDKQSGVIHPLVSEALLQVDHIFVLSFTSCRFRLSTLTSGKATCVIGRKLDLCAPKAYVRGPYTHALKVSFMHAVALQLAHDARYEHVAIIEDDAIVNDIGLSRNMAHEFGVLLRSNAWSFIRFGFRPFFLEESSRGHCPSKCRCMIHHGSVGEDFCELSEAGCDIRSSDFYVIRARFYLPFQRRITDLRQSNSKRIVDTWPMRSFAKQWLVIPQVSMQAQLDIPIDFQLGLGSLYVKKCVRPRPLSSRVSRQYFNVRLDDAKNTTKN